MLSPSLDVSSHFKPEVSLLPCKQLNNTGHIDCHVTHLPILLLLQLFGCITLRIYELYLHYWPINQQYLGVGLMCNSTNTVCAVDLIVYWCVDSQNESN